MGTFIPFRFESHRSKVQALYKRVLRDIESWHYSHHEMRIYQVLMRAEFDKNKNIKDPLKAKMLLEEGESKYNYIRCPDQLIHPTSHNGNAEDRIDCNKSPDWVLDYWHPLEKAQYPDYFARREERKKEYVEWYDKTYGKPKFEQLE